MSTSLGRITGGHIGTLPLTALRGRSSFSNVGFEMRDLEGVFGTGGGTCSLSASDASGVVARVAMDCPEPNELMLPHVFDELDEGRRVDGKGLDLERGFVGEDGAVGVGVYGSGFGVAFVGEPRAIERLEGDAGG